MISLQWICYTFNIRNKNSLNFSNYEFIEYDKILIKLCLLKCKGHSFFFLRCKSIFMIYILTHTLFRSRFESQ